MEFGVAIDRLGVLLVAATTGYLASSMAGGWLALRLGVGVLLTVSSALIVASAWGYALLTVWAALPLCALLAGLGAGRSTQASTPSPSRAFPPAR